MTEDFVPRREFERVIHEHERRLDGHDGLYGDLRDTREELVRFTEALKSARDQITSGLTDRDQCREQCVSHRTGFDGRIKALEKFRWQIGGALVLLSIIVPVLLRVL